MQEYINDVTGEVFECNDSMLIPQSYFAKIDTYNKDIKSIRKKVLKNFSDKDYFNMLRRFGFTIDKKDENFYIGIRVFNKKENGFSWITSDRKTKLLSKYIWDNSTKSYEKREFDYGFWKGFRRKHVLSANTCNFKFNFFRKGEIPDYAKEMFEPYKNALVNMQSIVDKTFGSSQELHVKALWFDIDNRNGKNSEKEFDKLNQYLGIDRNAYTLIEKNMLSGGIHAYLLLSSQVEDINFTENLEKLLKENGIDIECNFKRKILRFPFSYEYLPINPKTNDYYESIEDFFKSINSSFRYDPHIIFEKMNKFNYKKKMVNYWSNKPILFKRKSLYTNEFKKSKSLNLIDINPGNSWDATKRLVPYLKGQGKTLFEIATIIKQQDKGSNRYSNMDVDSIAKSLKKFYDKVNVKCSNTTCKQFDGFISNKKYLNKWQLSIIHNPKVLNMINDEYASYYADIRGINKLSKDKMEVFLLELPYFLEEIFGKWSFDFMTEKQFIDYRLNIFNGVQLLTPHLEKIQEYIIHKLGLEDNPYARNNIQYLKRAISKVLGIKEINFVNRRNWRCGCSKSFSIKSVCDMNKVIERLLNKVTTLINYLKKIGFINFPQNVYNISIQQNQWVYRDKEKIPIPIT